MGNLPYGHLFLMTRTSCVFDISPVCRWEIQHGQCYILFNLLSFLRDQWNHIQMYLASENLEMK